MEKKNKRNIEVAIIIIHKYIKLQPTLPKSIRLFLTYKKPVAQGFPTEKLLHNRTIILERNDPILGVIYRNGMEVL